MIVQKKWFFKREKKKNPAGSLEMIEWQISGTEAVVRDVCHDKGRMRIRKPRRVRGQGADG